MGGWVEVFFYVPQALGPGDERKDTRELTVRQNESCCCLLFCFQAHVKKGFLFFLPPSCPPFPLLSLLHMGLCQSAQQQQPPIADALGQDCLPISAQTKVRRPLFILPALCVCLSTLLLLLLPCSDRKLHIKSKHFLKGRKHRAVGANRGGAGGPLPP